MGMEQYQNKEVIQELITTQGVHWAVVGLSNKPERTAFKVSKFIRDELGMKITPVNLQGEDVHSEKGYKNLAQIPEHIDVVDCFVRSELVGDIVDQAIEIGAKAVWLQLGVIDKEAAHRAEQAGLKVVMDTCPAIEAKKLGLVKS